MKTFPSLSHYCRDSLDPVFNGFFFFFFLFGLSLKFHSWTHIKTARETLWPSSCLESNDVLYSHPLIIYPRDHYVFFVFVCRTDHPENVTMFFNQARWEFLCGFIVNLRGEIVLTSPNEEKYLIKEIRLHLYFPRDGRIQIDLFLQAFHLSPSTVICTPIFWWGRAT